MTVLDPAAGSGHFLVAAAHRIAKRLAQVRTEDEEPAPDAIRTALRDVIGRCLYAVDINPMAVELCKVSLWMEALEPGKPLTFLDHHVKCGNSLLGTTPELVAQGIPDAAYEPIEGDDKAVARALMKQNRAEREGQLTLGEAGLELPIEELAALAQQLGRLDQADMSQTSEMARRYRTLLDAEAYLHSRLVSDAWCSAFTNVKTDVDVCLTSADLRRLAASAQLESELVSRIAASAREHAFFHWPVEFPEVASVGGFDVVIGNPPWGASVDTRTKSLHRERYDAVRKGVLDTFAAFTQLDFLLARPSGSVGVVLPDIVLLKNYPELRRFLLTRTEITQIAHWGQAFPDANIDVCTLSVRTRVAAATHEVHALPDATSSGTSHERIRQEVFLTNKEYRFNLALSPETVSILAAMRALGPRVGDLFTIREGVHSGNVRDRLFLQAPDGELSQPLIFGRGEIVPMELHWEGRYIQLDASRFDRRRGDYYNIGDPALYATDKILVRRTGDFVLAAPDFEHYFCSNNFFLLVPSVEMSRSRLLYTAAALNSPFATAFFRLIQPRKGKLFAELKITHLEDIPVPFFGDTVADNEGFGLMEAAPDYGAALPAFIDRLSGRLLMTSPGIGAVVESGRV
jgi:hypothetical protein